VSSDDGLNVVTSLTGLNGSAVFAGLRPNSYKICDATNVNTCDWRTLRAGDVQEVTFIVQ